MRQDITNPAGKLSACVMPSARKTVELAYGNKMSVIFFSGEKSFLHRKMRERSITILQMKRRGSSSLTWRRNLCHRMFRPAPAKSAIERHQILVTGNIYGNTCLLRLQQRSLCIKRSQP